jgi:hypothetical protein
MSNETTVCGHQVQVDRSGDHGHAWTDISRENIPAQVLLELEGEMIDGKVVECDKFRASNGLCYRW